MYVVACGMVLQPCTMASCERISELWDVSNAHLTLPAGARQPLSLLLVSDESSVSKNLMLSVTQSGEPGADRCGVEGVTFSSGELGAVEAKDRPGKYIGRPE